MKDSILHTPEGVRDLQPSEALKMNVLNHKITETFHHYGYKNVQTPTFEYYNVFNHAKGTVDVKEMYKFFDREGNILVMRPDITPSVARFVSTVYDEDSFPKRLCYSGKTFRNNQSYQLKLKEFTQVGSELFGVDSPEADAEVIAIAINSLLATGLKEFKLELGQAAFFTGIVQEAGIDADNQEELRRLIDEKNFIAVEELLDALEISDEMKTTLLDLPKLFGSLEVLDQAKALTNNKIALEGLERLETVYNLLKEYELEQYVSFDLGMVTQLHYYTGIIFKGYTFGTGVSVLDGGRYDTLVSQFGKEVKAVGFAIILDHLFTALERQDIEVEVFTVDTLLVCDADNRAKAIKIAEQMRRDGMKIELSLIKQSDAELIEYGKTNGIGGIMLFTGSEDVTLINLSDDSRQTVNIADLM